MSSSTMTLLQLSFWSCSCFLIYQTDLVMGIKPSQMTGYDVAYQLAMDAYKNEKWAQCSEFFKSAIDNYHIHKNLVAECRLRCQPNKDISDVKILEDIFAHFLQKANCLRLCNKRTFGSRAEVEISGITTKKFEDGTPYKFLHYCYYRVNNFYRSI